MEIERPTEPPSDALLLLRAQPLVFEEAIVNSRTRIPFEQALANWLRLLPPVPFAGSRAARQT